MRLSVIVPVHNGGEDLQRCLQGLAVSTRPPDEIIVVDDGSTDDSAAHAAALAARVVATTAGPRGPAYARNRGAEAATGDVLVFVDADVVVHADTLARIEAVLLGEPEVAALFGSYDDDPPARSAASLYKNLLHHHVHQHGEREAGTFWAGCGAVRRAVFLAAGGFDESYSRPSIEDIELGVRLAHRHLRPCGSLDTPDSPAGALVLGPQPRLARPPECRGGVGAVWVHAALGWTRAGRGGPAGCVARAGRPALDGQPGRAQRRSLWLLLPAWRGALRFARCGAAQCLPALQQPGVRLPVGEPPIARKAAASW